MVICETIKIFTNHHSTNHNIPINILFECLNLLHQFCQVVDDVALSRLEMTTTTTTTTTTTATATKGGFRLDITSRCFMIMSLLMVDMAETFALNFSTETNIKLSVSEEEDTSSIEMVIPIHHLHSNTTEKKDEGCSCITVSSRSSLVQVKSICHIYICSASLCLLV